MNFNHSEEQAMLNDSVNKFIQIEYDIDKRRELAATTLGYSKEHWQTYASLGWLSIPFAEELGGFGGNILDIAVVTEALGKGLVLEPYVETVVLFGGLLAAAVNHKASDSQTALIEKLIAGEVIATAGLTESNTRFSPFHVESTAKKTGEGYLLSGQKFNITALPSANFAIVSARTSGAKGDRDGISLFLINLEEDNVSRTEYRLMDGRTAGNLQFDQLSLSADRLLGVEGQAAALLDEVLPLVMLAECAEAVGIMEFLNTTTLEYTKVRKQFGMPIGSFQALQHRMVDTFMAYEQTKSLLFRALISWQDQAEEFKLDLAALKVQSGRAGKLIASEAIQIHGGMGLTDELSIGHYMKRLRMLNASYGDADFHQNQYNQLEFTS